MNKKLILFSLSSLVILGVITRLLPHIPNATPLTAIALTSSYYLGTRWSIILPTIILMVSDFFIGFYDWRIMASVYTSFLLIGAISWFMRKRHGLLPTLFVVVGSSLLFFLITNACVWIFSPWYEKSIFGLLYAYDLGIPFFRSMLVGDFIYGFLIVTLFETSQFLCQTKFFNFKYKYVT